MPPPRRGQISQQIFSTLVPLLCLPPFPSAELFANKVSTLVMTNGPSVVYSAPVKPEKASTGSGEDSEILVRVHSVLDCVVVGHGNHEEMTVRVRAEDAGGADHCLAWTESQQRETKELGEVGKCTSGDGGSTRISRAKQTVKKK